MGLPTNQSIKDLFEGLLGREVTLSYGRRPDMEARPGPCTAVYVDDRNQLTSVVVMDFGLTASAGAALGLVPPGGAEAAIEDRELPESLQENANELLNVLAGTINEHSDVHQRLYRVHVPGETLPADVVPWTITLTGRVDVTVSPKGYPSGDISIVSVLPV
ncbi:hypothetical protein [Angustibacter sp. Root456]|uniref:hypothetical protein n=1 Tax=Angustibacter sp. Root456 TaxID=1736539 RepID=UPI0006F75421|nr:hypothetical protein [Angustibacter sp. Root456]KQX64559.1 hypothetical protein ASD06_10450 [Angustibacter sp. Root456]